MAEITKDGATGTTLSEYLDVMRQKYLDIDDGWDIDPESPDGLAIAAWCETLANLDEGLLAPIMQRIRMLPLGVHSKILPSLQA